VVARFEGRREAAGMVGAQRAGHEQAGGGGLVVARGVGCFRRGRRGDWNSRGGAAPGPSISTRGAARVGVSVSVTASPVDSELRGCARPVRVVRGYRSPGVTRARGPRAPPRPSVFWCSNRGCRATRHARAQGSRHPQHQSTTGCSPAPGRHHPNRARGQRKNLGRWRCAVAARCRRATGCLAGRQRGVVTAGESRVAVCGDRFLTSTSRVGYFTDQR
jgi:hypothetical protein